MPKFAGITRKGFSCMKGVPKWKPSTSTLETSRFRPVKTSSKSLFEQYGRVEQAKIIVDRATGRSKGFGFVEMSEREEGLKAIEELDSKDFMGRTLRVNEARPRKGRF